MIEIGDDDFGTWYIDCMEHPNRYDGRTVRVKGQCFNMQNLPKKTFVFGRYAMTCCAADVGGIGFLCRYADKRPKTDTWFYLTAKVESGFSVIHNRDAVILLEIKSEPAEKPEEELVQFNP